MTADELTAFEARGKKINYGGKRAAKQKLNDQRYDQRKERNGLMMSVVTEVVATWNPTSYPGKHRAIVREILEKSRNQRRRKLSGMPTMQRRHQEAIRLVYALALDDISQAEYCQRHKLDPADASRMLAHLYEKEPGLKDAIGAISACGTVTSWQNRQQKQKLCDKREGVTLVFGFDYSEAPDHGGWIKLADLSAGCVKSYRAGKTESIAVWDDIPLSRFRTVSANRFERIHLPQYLDRPKTWRVPSKPFDLHKPATWFDCETYYRFALTRPFWEPFVDPAHPVARYKPLPDRYRSISRAARLKNGGREVWRIARTLDRSRPIPDRFDDGILDAWRSWSSQIKVLDLPAQALRPPQGIFGYRFKLDGPIHVVIETFDLPAGATLDIKTRDLPVGKHENKLHSGGVSRIFRGLPVADCNGKSPPSLKQSWGAIEDRLAEAKWSDGPMCRPYHTTKLCGPWRFRVRFHQPTNATRIKPFTKLGAICWLGPLRRATAKDWAEWKRKRPKDYADFFASKVTAERSRNISNPLGGSRGDLCQVPIRMRSQIEQIAAEEFVPVPDTVRALVQRAIYSRQLERNRREQGE